MRSQIVLLITSFVAVLLQVVLAPLIAFSSVVPNFLITLVIVLSIVRKADSTYVYAFCLGLVSDLLAQTPLGLGPLLLLLISFALSRAFEVMDKTTFVMPVISCVISVFAFEFISMLVLLALGYSASFIDLFVYRVLPLLVYNSILCVIYYALSRKISFGDNSSDVWSVSSENRYR